MKTRNVSDFPISNSDFIDLRSPATTMFDGFAAVFNTGRAVFPREDGSPEQIPTAAVTNTGSAGTVEIRL
jgi:hypothetical protein